MLLYCAASRRHNGANFKHNRTDPATVGAATRPLEKEKVESPAAASQIKIISPGAKELEELLGSVPEKKTQQPSLFYFGRNRRGRADKTAAMILLQKL